MHGLTNVAAERMSWRLILIGCGFVAAHFVGLSLSIVRAESTIMTWQGELADVNTKGPSIFTGNGSTSGSTTGTVPGLIGPWSNWGGRPILGKADDGTTAVVSTVGPEAGDVLSFWTRLIDLVHPDAAMKEVTLSGLPKVQSAYLHMYANYSGGTIEATDGIYVATDDDFFGLRGPVGEMLPTGVYGSTLSAPYVEFASAARIDMDANSIIADTVSLTGFTKLGTATKSSINITSSLIEADLLSIGNQPGDWELRMDTATVVVAEDIVIGPANGALTLALKGDDTSSFITKSATIAPTAESIVRLNIDGPSVPFSPLAEVQIGAAGQAQVNVKNHGVLNTAVTLAAVGPGSVAEVQLDQGTWTTKDMFLGGLGSATVTAKDSLMNSDNVVIGATASPYIALVTLDETSVWNVGGYLRVGRDGFGELQVKQETLVDAEQEIVLGTEKDSTGTVDVTTKATLKTNTTFEVGRNGQGTLNVKEGGIVESNSHFFLGSYKDGVGQVLVEGEGSKLEIKHGNLNIGNGDDGASSGQNGKGTFEVKAGGELKVASETEIRVGRHQGSVGELILGGAESTFGGNESSAGAGLQVGVDGTGTLQLHDSFQFNWQDDDEGEGFTLKFGINEHGKGILRVEGEGTEMRTNSLNLGYDGSGEGHVSQKAFLNVDRLTIGHKNLETESTLTVEDEGTVMEVTGKLLIGEEGKGKLTIHDAKFDIHDTEVILGQKPKSEGTFEVRGDKSQVAYDSTKLTIGDEGKGTLRVSDGAKFSLYNQSVDIVELAKKAKSESVLEITGKGTDDKPAEIEYIGALAIGVGGKATVTVSDGGKLTGFASGGPATVIGGTTGADRSETTLQASGEVTIKEKGSSWTLPGELTIGKASHGTLRIEEGGKVELANNQKTLFATDHKDSNADLVIKGKDADSVASKLTYKGDLGIGEMGTATIKIEEGGQLLSDQQPHKVTLAGKLENFFEPQAGNEDASATVTIDGAGSNWTHFGDISLATEGDASITLKDGGSLKMNLGNESSTLYMQGYGHATLTVEPGGQLAVRQVEMGGYHDDRPNLIDMHGTASKPATAEMSELSLNQNSRVTIGTYASLTLKASDGEPDTGASALKITGTYTDDGIGTITGHTASVVVDGAQASIEADQRGVFVNRGELKLLNGGTLHAKSLEVLASNQITVDGENSQLSIIDTIKLADGPTQGFTNHMDIVNQGKVLANQLQLDGTLMQISTQGSLQVTQSILISVPDPLHGVSADAATLLVYADSSAITPLISVGSHGAAFASGADAKIIATNSKVAGLLSAAESGQIKISSTLETLGGGVSANSGGNLIVGSKIDMHGGSLQAAGGGITIGGSAALAAPGSILVNAGGILSGNGELKGKLVVAGGALDDHGFLLNGAKIDIGHSPGTLLVDGDAEFLSGSVLKMEIGGLTPDLDYDVLKVLGKASFNGILDISFINGFAPQQGDQFSLLGSTEFAFGGEIVIRNLAPGFEYETHYTEGKLQLTALNNGHLVPEPSAALLLLAGIASLAVVKTGRQARTRHGGQRS